MGFQIPGVREPSKISTNIETAWTSIYELTSSLFLKKSNTDTIGMMDQTAKQRSLPVFCLELAARIILYNGSIKVSISRKKVKHKSGKATMLRRVRLFMSNHNTVSSFVAATRDRVFSEIAFKAAHYIAYIMAEGGWREQYRFETPRGRKQPFR